MKAQYSNTIIYIYNILLYDSAWLGFGFGLAWFFQSICVNCTYICIYNVCVCIIYIFINIRHLSRLCEKVEKTQILIVKCMVIAYNPRIVR